MLNSFVSVLDSGGAGGGGAAFESIATATGTGSNTSVTFSSIPSTYTSLQIRAIYRDTNTPGATRQNLNLEFNGSAGTNYAVHYLQGEGATVSAAGFTAYPFVVVNGAGAGGGTSSNIFGASIIDIHDYASTSRNKTVRYLAGINDNTATAANQRISIGSGLWLSTSAITSIKVICGDTAFATGTTISLYGIKGA